MTKGTLTSIAIRALGEREPIPYDLLLLADPSKVLIDAYLVTSVIYIALLVNDVIGTYVLYPINAETVEIKNIAVAKAHQGKGVGKLLLKDAFQRAKSNGFKTILIATGNASIGQLYLYQKEGFEITGIKKDFFINNYAQPIFENGIQVKHMILLSRPL